MRQVYRFLLKSGVQMRLSLTAEEFTKRVKRGRIRLRNGDVATLISQPPALTTGCYSACWPMKGGYNVAVHSSQIQAAMAEDARLGVPTMYDHDGSPVFESNEHRTRWAQAHKFYEVCAAGPSGPQRLDDREREIRAMMGKSVRKCDDQRGNDEST